jgi:hypothetical protein
VRGCKGFECELRAGRSDRWEEGRVMLNAGKGYTKLISETERDCRSLSRVESSLRIKRGGGVIIPS